MTLPAGQRSEKEETVRVGENEGIICEAVNAECKRFAALDVILLGHIQTLNWHERLFLGLLVKSLMK